MSERVSVVCENCGQNLWIRLRNVGRIGKCKYCGYLFQAQMGEDCDLTLRPLSRVAKVADESRGAKDDGSTTTSRRRRVREPLAVVPQEQGVRASDPFEPPPSPDPSPPSEHRWEAAHSQVSEIRTEVSALRDRTSQVDQLKQRLQTELAEIEQIQAQIQEARSRFEDPEVQAALDKVHEVEALRGECNRFREEAQALRSQLEAQSADERARTEDLTRQYEEACAERKRLDVELQRQASEGERTRNLLGAEREAMVRELEALQNRLDGLERGQDETEYEHHQARTAWEEERLELQAWSERRRQELLEAEQRSAELQGRVEAERQAWDQQRLEHERRIADGGARLLEAERLQGRTARERDARIQDVEHLTEQLATLEQSHAAAEAEWKADREEVRAQAGRQRQELVDDAERRLGQLRAQFEASRRERDAVFRQLEAAVQERDRLQGQVEELESAREEAERSGQAETDRLVAALEQVRRESKAAAQRGAEEVRTLRSELERQRAARKARDEESERKLVALRRAWEVERRRWRELLAAVHPESLASNPANFNTTESSATQPQDVSTSGGEDGAATRLRARPQASSYHDPETFRSQLEQWMGEAQARPQDLNAPPGQSDNEGWAAWLEYEMNTAREELALLEHSADPGERAAVNLEQL